jgi:hypothetical protein
VSDEDELDGLRKQLEGLHNSYEDLRRESEERILSLEMDVAILKQHAGLSQDQATDDTSG